MSLINLTEEYLKNGNPSLYDRIRLALDLDLYWASSLLAIEEHFRQYSPRKKDKWSSHPSAYIVMKNLYIKRMSSDLFDENDGVSLTLMDEGLDYPLFEIKDKTRLRLAYWMAGNSERYLKAKDEFGFNEENYVLIPKIYLQYRIDEKGGWFTIRAIDSERKPQKRQKEKKGLRDKILEFIDDKTGFGIWTPQPTT